MSDPFVVRILVDSFVLRQLFSKAVHYNANPFVLRIDPIIEQKLSGER